MATEVTECEVTEQLEGASTKTEATCVEPNKDTQTYTEAQPEYQPVANSKEVEQKEDEIWNQIELVGLSPKSEQQKLYIAGGSNAESNVSPGDDTKTDEQESQEDADPTYTNNSDIDEKVGSSSLVQHLRKLEEEAESTEDESGASESESGAEGRRRRPSHEEYSEDRESDSDADREYERKRDERKRSDDSPAHSSGDEELGDNVHSDGEYIDSDPENSGVDKKVGEVKNPTFCPKRTGFWSHDDRFDDISIEETRQPQRNRKLWDKAEVDRWDHDKYVESEQGPKEPWEIEQTIKELEDRDRRSTRGGRRGRNFSDFVPVRGRTRARGQNQQRDHGYRNRNIDNQSRKSFDDEYDKKMSYSDNRSNKEGWPILENVKINDVNKLQQSEHDRQNNAKKHPQQGHSDQKSPIDRHRFNKDIDEKSQENNSDKNKNDGNKDNWNNTDSKLNKRDHARNNRQNKFVKNERNLENQHRKSEHNWEDDTQTNKEESNDHTRNNRQNKFLKNERNLENQHRKSEHNWEDDTQTNKGESDKKRNRTRKIDRGDWENRKERDDKRVHDSPQDRGNYRNDDNKRKGAGKGLGRGRNDENENQSREKSNREKRIEQLPPRLRDKAREKMENEEKPKLPKIEYQHNQVESAPQEQYQDTEVYNAAKSPDGAPRDKPKRYSSQRQKTGASMMDIPGQIPEGEEGKAQYFAMMHQPMYNAPILALQQQNHGIPNANNKIKMLENQILMLQNQLQHQLNLQPQQQIPNLMSMQNIPLGNMLSQMQSTCVDQNIYGTNAMGYPDMMPNAAAGVPMPSPQINPIILNQIMATAGIQQQPPHSMSGDGGLYVSPIQTSQHQFQMSESEQQQQLRRSRPAAIPIKPPPGL